MIHSQMIVLTNNQVSCTLHTNLIIRLQELCVVTAVRTVTTQHHDVSFCSAIQTLQKVDFFASAQLKGQVSCSPRSSFKDLLKCSALSLFYFMP